MSFDLKIHDLLLNIADMSFELKSFDLSILHPKQAITQLFFVWGKALLSRSNVKPAE